MTCFILPPQVLTRAGFKGISQPILLIAAKLAPLMNLGIISKMGRQSMAKKTRLNIGEKYKCIRSRHCEAL